MGGGGGKSDTPEQEPLPAAKPPAPPPRDTTGLEKPKSSVKTETKSSAKSKQQAASSVYANTQTLGSTAQEANTVYKKMLGGG